MTGILTLKAGKWRKEPARSTSRVFIYFATCDLLRQTESPPGRTVTFGVADADASSRLTAVREQE